MTDEELIKHLRAEPEIVYRYVSVDHAAADRIEKLAAQLKMVLEREAETQARHDKKIDDLEAKLSKAVEDAFCEGFAEGYDGTWVEGDYTHAWKKSHALVNLEKAK